MHTFDSGHFWLLPVCQKNFLADSFPWDWFNWLHAPMHKHIISAFEAVLERSPGGNESLMEKVLNWTKRFLRASCQDSLGRTRLRSGRKRPPNFFFFVVPAGYSRLARSNHIYLQHCKSHVTFDGRQPSNCVSKQLDVQPLRKPCSSFFPGFLIIALSVMHVSEGEQLTSIRLASQSS